MPRKKIAARDNIDPNSGLNLGYLAESFGYQVRRTHNAVLREYESRVTAVDVSARYLGLLLLVDTNPGAAQSRIAEAVGVDRSTIVPMIDRLESEGYLDRRPSEHDARSNGLWLTRKGLKTVARLNEVAAQIEAKIFAGFSSAERNSMRALMQRVLDNLEE